MVEASFSKVEMSSERDEEAPIVFEIDLGSPLSQFILKIGIPSFLVFIGLISLSGKVIFHPGISGGPLLPLTYKIFGHFESSTAILFAALIFSLRALTIYPLIKRVTENTQAVVAAAWLISFHPIFLNLINQGDIHVITGLLILPLTLHSYIKYKESQTQNTSLMMALIVLTLLIDISTSIVLLGVIASYNILSLLLKREKKTTNPVITIAACLLALIAILRVSQTEVSWPFQMKFFAGSYDIPLLILTFIASLPGLLTLYKQKRWELFLLLSSWMVIPWLLTFFYYTGINFDFSYFPIFSLYPMIILSTFILPSFLSREKMGIDLKKLQETTGTPRWALKINTERLIISIILILLISTTLFYGATEFAHTVTLQNIDSERFKEREKQEIINFIHWNTPRNSTFVADEAFGEKMKINRNLLINKPIVNLTSQEEIQASDAADIILHTNYEIRNRHLRLRDWGPYDNMRCPFIAIAKNKTYIDLAYIDDGYARTTFTKLGKTWVEAPFKFKVIGSWWLQRTKDLVVLRHSWETPALFINRTITLQGNNPEFMIIYDIQPKIGVTITKFDLWIWIPWDRAVKHTKPESPKGPLIIETDSGTMRLEFGASINEVSYGPDPEWYQPRVLLTFSPTGDKIRAKVKVTMLDPIPYQWAEDGISSFSSSELLEKYNIEYVVAPIKSRVEYTLRFYSDQKYIIAFKGGNNISIFKVRTQTEKVT